MRIDQLDFRLLRYFTVVAEELHFGRAAARLGIAQPPLSQQIKRLEKLVGVELFQRTSRRVALTDAGTTLLVATERVMKEMLRAADEAKAVALGQSGTLTVGYVHLAMLALLPSLIRTFLKQHPHVRMTMHGVPTSTQLEMLRGGAIDVAFGSEVEPATGLAIHKRWVEPLVYVRPRSRAAEAYGLILIPRQQSPHLYDCILEEAQALEVGTTVIQESDSWHSVVSLVGAGLGYTIAPDTVRRYRVPGVQYQSLKARARKVSVSLVTRDERLSPALQAFVELAR